MVIVVLGKKRLEPSEMSDISAMLKFFNHGKNPDKFLFLVNERRKKGSSRETKETNLSLSLLEVDNPKILQIGSDAVNDTSNSLAMTVSNIENDDFKEELKQIKDFLHAANEMTNLLQLPEKTSSQKSLLDGWNSNCGHLCILPYQTLLLGQKEAAQNVLFYTK